MDNGTMENDHWSDGETKPKSRFGKVARYIALSLVVLVYGLIFFRLFIKSDPDSAKGFIWTESSVAAYESDPDSFTIQTQKICTYQKQIGKDEQGIPMYETVSHNDITSDGSFMISNLMYVPSNGELTITVRYNRSATESLMEECALDALPKGEPFFFALEGVGEDGKGYAVEYTYYPSSRFTYEYRRLVFSDVKLPTNGVVSLNVYFVDNVELSSPLVFNSDSKTNRVELSLPIYDSYLGMDEYKTKKALPAELCGELVAAPYVNIKE